MFLIRGTWCRGDGTCGCMLSAHVHGLQLNGGVAMDPLG